MPYMPKRPGETYHVHKGKEISKSEAKELAARAAKKEPKPGTEPPADTVEASKP